tara:strand:- start:1819 stop:2694 length:876 start_codon:yes stop_codon:yes gene_type:complete
MSRVASIPVPGHGYGATEGSFAVKDFEGTGSGVLINFKNDGSETIHHKCPVYCKTSFVDDGFDDWTFTEIQQFTQSPKHYGYSQPTTGTEDDDSPLGTCIGKVEPGESGKAIVGGTHLAWVETDGSGDDADGMYIDTGTTFQSQSHGISGAHKRRHVGVGKIIELVDASLTDIGSGSIILAVIRRLPLALPQRWLVANVTAPGGDLGQTAYSYTTWIESHPGDGATGATTCPLINYVEQYLGWQDSDDIGDWHMRQMHGKLWANLSFNRSAGTYTCTCSLSPQFMGECSEL